LQRPGWQAAQPWEVAQDIQVSAWDGRPRAANHFSTIYGGNYESQVGEATRILQVIQADSAKATCAGTGGSDLGSAPVGPANGHGLPSGYVIPPSSPAARIAVQAALAELGKPYVFGATGPATFDCSGLMQWAWARAGIDLPHYTGDQWRAGAATTPTALLPGDLVLVPGSDGTLADPQHVGMFIGQGAVVEAPQTGDVVKVVTYASFVGGGLSGLRHIA
jgi:cell wall-associated NlpC family hydrolase